MNGERWEERRSAVSGKPKESGPLTAHGSPLTVVGWLWRDPLCMTQYTVEHANIWARRLDESITLPHRFVVLTDTPDANFDPLIEPVSLWGQWREVVSPLVPRERPQCYVKLNAFGPEAAARIGPRFCSIDLDCVVTGNLDAILSRPEDFIIWRRADFDKRFDFLQRGFFQSSMWMMNAGARPDVYGDFHGAETLDSLRNHPRAEQYLHTEQGWLLYKLEQNGEATWDARDGIFDFRWLAARAAGDGVSPTKAAKYAVPELPGEAKIVMFPGKIKPWDRMDVPWIGENWQ